MLSAAISVLFILSGFSTPQDMPEKYRKWLEEEVVYIISDKEKDIFSHLNTASQRDRFIEEFWMERDPSPGSVRNEFREEHDRRIEYANKWFGRETGQAGWKTDKGRIYILLGPPREKSEFHGSARLYPCELWKYESDYSQGLPPYFNCIFFKKNGLWDFILYNPSKHTPDHLVQTGAGESPDMAPAIIAEISPLLAKAAISLLPSEQVDVNNYRGNPSLSSIQLMAAIRNIPNFRRDYSYAERIYRGEGRISTNYTFTAQALPSNFHVIKMESGYSLLNYAFHYPKGIKLGKYGSNMYLSLNIFFQVENADGQIIISGEKKLEKEFSDISASKLETQGLVYEDMYLLLPGQYNISLTVSNNVSKKFFAVSEKITVRDYVADQLHIDPPLLFHYSKKDPNISLSSYPPYAFSDVKFQPLLSAGIQKGQELGVMYQLHCEPESENSRMLYKLINRRGETINENRVIVEKRNFNINGTATVFWRLSTSDLPEDSYHLELIASSGENEVRIKSRSFRVGRNPVPPDVVTLEGKQFNFLTPEPTIQSITQLIQQENYETAERMLRNALEKWPKETMLDEMFSEVLMKNEKYIEAKNILNTQILKDSENYKARFQLGLLLLRTGKYPDSINELESVRLVEGDHPDVLNPLGEAYQLLGNLQKAKAIWETSLKIDPSQELLKKRLEEIQ